MSDLDQLDKQLTNLKQRGVSLAQHPARARLEAHRMHRMAKDDDLRSTVLGSYAGPQRLRVERMVREGGPEAAKILEESQALADAMGTKRLTSQRIARRREMEQRQIQRTSSSLGGIGTSVGGDAVTAIPRFYDPLEYFDLTGVPWNMADEGHRHKLHKWLRLFASTHYLIPALIDIFTRFPLAGMELESKDPKHKQFYEEAFLGNLKYDEFFVMLGKEFWTVSEAFTAGSFDENLGIWEHEEFIHPENVTIEHFALLNSTQFKITPPDHLKKLAQEKRPAKEYKILKEQFGDMIPYLLAGKAFPVSPVMMKQVANKVNPWDDHGTPLLLRGLRTLLHEEKLMASQDAIAERLYSPLILAKLGIMDLGDQQGPWIPGPDELEVVRDDLDMALASDFRLMVHHFGLEITNVFGREQMPRLGEDFDRIERRLMQTFGVNPSLLSAGANTQPYASSALQAEFLNQVLRTYQGYLKQHFRERALVVAEANEHYDYYMKGDKRIPIMERVVTGYDEEQHPIIEEVPKLLVPDLKFSTLDMRDEATERQFLQTLRTLGVPIPDSKLMVGVPYDIEELSKEFVNEIVTKTVDQQEGKMKAYTILWTKGYPIPAELKAEVESVLQGPGTPSVGAPGGPGGLPVGGGPAPGAAGGPGESIIVPPAPPGLGPQGAGGPIPGGGPPSAGPVTPGPAGAVPEISNERRPGMPTASSVEHDPDDPNIASIANWVRAHDANDPKDRITARWLLAHEPDNEDLRVVASWLDGEKSATLDETEDERPVIDMDDDRFELGTFEEFKEDDRGGDRVVAKLGRKDSRSRNELRRKRYSIIDEDRKKDEDASEQDHGREDADQDASSDS